jgi:hypothetical protein
MRSCNFGRLMFNKVILRSYSYFLKFSYFFWLRSGFFQIGQNLQKLVKKTKGILGVNMVTFTLSHLVQSIHHYWAQSTFVGAHQEPNGRPLPVHWLFLWPTGPLQTKNLCKGSLNISLDTPSYNALPFFECAWSKGDLPKKDRKYLTFGKEKINSSKDSFGSVFL